MGFVSTSTSDAARFRKVASSAELLGPSTSPRALILCPCIYTLCYPAITFCESQGRTFGSSTRTHVVSNEASQQRDGQRLRLHHMRTGTCIRLQGSAGHQPSISENFLRDEPDSKSVLRDTPSTSLIGIFKPPRSPNSLLFHIEVAQSFSYITLHRLPSKAVQASSFEQSH